MATEVVEQNEETVEYVELLDVPMYEDDQQQEIVTLDGEGIIVETSSPQSMLHEVIAIGEHAEPEDVQYIEAEEVQCEDVDMQDVAEHQTIIVHDGRQYVIPMEQLSHAGQTIVLEDGRGGVSLVAAGGGAGAGAVDADGEPAYYAEVDAAAAEQLLGHMGGDGGDCYVVYGGEHEEDGGEQPPPEPGGVQLEEAEVEEEEVGGEGEGEEEEEDVEGGDAELDEQLCAITGRDLLTGQTISLSGFLEKMRRRSAGGGGRRGRERRAAEASARPDYVLVPPVNRRVVVGRTPDGRRLVGRILQIQKKIPPQPEPPVHRAVPYARGRGGRRRTPQPQPRRQVAVKPEPVDSTEQQEQEGGGGGEEEEQGESVAPRNVVVKRRYVSRQFLDENVSRTLAGLMELESVARSVAGRRLVVRHVQRRSAGGRPVAGSRRVAYYCGRMRRAPGGWHFAPDALGERAPPPGIDLQDAGAAPDSQQLHVPVDGATFGALGDLALAGAPPPPPAGRRDPLHVGDDDDDDDDEGGGGEPVTLNLTVTQDEFGKKRTKVTIPQLVRPARGDDAAGAGDAAAGHACSVCGKRFHAVGSLRRHALTHGPALRGAARAERDLLEAAAKRYSCDVCGRQFNRHSNLVRHADIHRPPAAGTSTTVNATANATEALDPEGGGGDVRAPFMCEVCGCQYNFASSLTRHIVNNHMAPSAAVAAVASVEIADLL